MKLQLCRSTSNHLLDLFLDLLNDLLSFLLNSLEATEDISLDLHFVELLRRDSALLENASQPRSLLLNPILTSVNDLIHHLQIVLVLLSSSSREQLCIFYKLTTSVACSNDKPRSEAVEFGVTASGVVEETTSRAICTATGVEEFDKRLFRTSLIVILWLLLVVSAEEFDGGEGSDAVLLCEWSVGSSIGIDIGNDTLKELH